MRALALSLLALAVPVAGVFWFPAELADYAALAWLLALIPAFLLAHQRGWSGVATALATGMVALTVTYVIAQSQGREVPDLLFGVVLAYLILALGIGWLAERVGRDRLSEVADLALIDPLTGLPNREQAERFLEKEFAAARLGRPIALVLFELDEFAAFIARNGQAAGNGVLRAFATLLRQNTRRMNLSARYDAEEFLCILSGSSEEGATVFGERVLQQLRAAASMAALPTASAGIACYRAGMHSPDVLVSAAREALAKAMADGGDRIRVHGYALPERGLEAQAGAEADDPLAGRIAAEAARVQPADVAAVRAGTGHSAFVLCRDPDVRRAVVDELAAEGFHVTEARGTADSTFMMNAEFDVVVADLPPAPERFHDLRGEIRRRFPATRIVGVPVLRDGRIAASALLSAPDGFAVPVERGIRFAPPLAELLADAEFRRRIALQTRQLADEVRARERTARLALEASEARYQSIVQQVHEVVFQTDASGAWTFLNPAWTAITGHAVDDSIGRDALEHIHGEDHARLRERFRALLAGRSGYLRDEVRCLAKDGEVRWLEVRAQSMGEVGQPTGARGTLTDVTDRRNAEVALRRSEAYFRSLIENSSDIMAVLDPAGTVRYISPALRRVSGLRPEDVTGRPFLELVHEDDASRVADALGSVVRKAGSTLMIDVRAQPRTATPRWLEMSLTNMTREPGVEGVVVNARDVTDRRDAERALRESEELIHRTRRMDAIGRLAGGVAHDFNNLLLAIQGHADLLLGQLEEKDARRRDVAQIQDATRRAAALTRQLLAFGRRQVLRPREFALNDVTAEAVRIMQRLLDDGITVDFVPGAEPDRVFADPARIEQALLNLAMNARDAMAADGRLSLETGNATVAPDAPPLPDAAEPGDYVVLTMRDSGRGMDAETLAHIFDPFFTTREDAGGAGLGLSTVYGIVKQSGGAIWAESTPGKGTTFTIYLPRGAGHTEAGSDTTAETIVIVEDEATVRRLAERILSERGFRVVSEGDGRTALARIARYPDRIDLLLTDVVMPGMNGRELAERVAALRPGIRVLYMSGYPGSTILEQGVLPEGIEFLEKPFSPDDLYRKVRAVLDATVPVET